MGELVLERPVLVAVTGDRHAPVVIPALETLDQLHAGRIEDKAGRAINHARQALVYRIQAQRNIVGRGRTSLQTDSAQDLKRCGFIGLRTHVASRVAMYEYVTGGKRGRDFMPQKLGKSHGSHICCHQLTHHRPPATGQLHAESGGRRQAKVQPDMDIGIFRNGNRLFGDMNLVVELVIDRLAFLDHAKPVHHIDIDP